MNNLKVITDLLRELPGISLKTAERLSISLIENKLKNINLLEQVIEISKKLEKDLLTGLIIEKGSIANVNKEKDILLVIDSNKDVANVVEKTSSVKSIFVLDMPNKRNFDNTSDMLKRMFEVVEKYETKEILFLLTPSIESELIMRVVKEEFEKNFKFNKPDITRISMGIPFGGSIEFSDERTIREAMKKREKA